MFDRLHTRTFNLTQAPGTRTLTLLKLSMLPHCCTMEYGQEPAAQEPACGFSWYLRYVRDPNGRHPNHWPHYYVKGGLTPLSLETVTACHGDKSVMISCLVVSQGLNMTQIQASIQGDILSANCISKVQSEVASLTNPNVPEANCTSRFLATSRSILLPSTPPALVPEARDAQASISIFVEITTNIINTPYPNQ